MAKANREKSSSISAKELKAVIAGLIEKQLKHAHKKINALELAVDKLKVIKKSEKDKEIKVRAGEKVKNSAKTGKAQNEKLKLVQEN